MIEEIIDNDAGSYSVKFRNREYAIYRTWDDYGSWYNATYAFFAIVNDQLADSKYRFFAINGGNDLGGIFLTPSEAKTAQEGLADKRDWPYMPTNEPPWYGKPG
jgi:hypothetical protein